MVGPENKSILKGFRASIDAQVGTDVFGACPAPALGGPDEPEMFTAFVRGQLTQGANVQADELAERLVSEARIIRSEWVGLVRVLANVVETGPL